MILPRGYNTQYLLDYRDGKINKGLGIGCSLDDYILFKRKQLNIVLGHDNVGKSYWMLWYFLALATNHKLKFLLWMGENSSGQIMRDLVQMFAGVKYSEISKNRILQYQDELEQYFQFISNEKMYSPFELLDIIKNSDCDVAFIDPFTGLNRGMQHSDNYEFLNTTREFCNSTGKTLYISTHPNSESGRSGMIYSQDHQWFGHLKPPLKAHIEGGKPFLNRCDDMIVIHRLIKHPEMKFMTMIDIEKVKDRDTGGQQTELNNPLLFDYNYGLGFKIGGIDPIKRREQQNNNFDDGLPF